MNKRKEALEKIIRFDDDWKEAQHVLSEFAWDSEDELVFITAKEIAAALELVMARSDYSSIEQWANLIESREDVGYESEQAKEVIEELANPVLYGDLDEERIGSLIKMLRK